jgi:PST family polysaccharide transporter
MTVALWASHPFRPTPRPVAREIRTIWSFSWNLTVFNVVGYSLQNADRVVVAHLIGATALGFYSAAQRIVVYLVLSLTQAAMDVMFPALSRLQHREDEIGRTFLRAMGGVALVVFPLIALLSGLAGPLIRALLGETWAPAAPIAAILVPAATLDALQQLGTTLYRAKGRTDLLRTFGLAYAVASLAAFALGARIGLLEAVLAYALAQVALAYPAFAIPLRLVGLRPLDLLRAVWPYLGISLGVAAVAAGVARVAPEWGLHPLLTVAAGGLLGLGFYAIALLALRPQSFEDVRRLIAAELRSRRPGRS